MSAAHCACSDHAHSDHAPYDPDATAAIPVVAASGRYRRSHVDIVGRVIDVVAHTGSLVTLAALLVIAGTAGGLADGVTPDRDSAVTVTFDGDRR